MYMIGQNVYSIDEAIISTRALCIVLELFSSIRPVSKLCQTPDWQTTKFGIRFVLTWQTILWFVSKRIWNKMRLCGRQHAGRRRWPTMSIVPSAKDSCIKFGRNSKSGTFETNCHHKHSSGHHRLTSTATSLIICNLERAGWLARQFSIL